MDTKPINIKLSSALIDKLDSLSERLQNHPELGYGTVNRSKLIRYCITAYIPELERMAREGRNHGE